MCQSFPPQHCVSKHNCFSLIDLQLVGYRFAKSPLRLLQRATQCGELAQISPYFVGSKVVPGGGVEPPRYQVPADFESAESAASASSAMIINNLAKNSCKTV